MQKRGAIGLQFNWIFVLIVGALIIAFFIMVIRNQMDSADYETQVTVQTKLNSLMQNALQNPGSLFEITLKDVVLHYDDCNDGFYINGNRNLRIELGPTFAPNLVKSDRNQFLLWTLPWDVPFTVTNMMFVTNKDVRYILIYNEDDDEASSFIDTIMSSPRETSLPEELKVEKKSISHFDLNGLLLNENYYKVKFVFINYCPNLNIGLDSADFSAVCITIDGKIYDDSFVKEIQGGLDGYGDIFFYDEDLILGDFYGWLGRPSLFGAIFAEDIDQFKCVMEKAYTRRDDVNKVYYDRTKAIDKYYENNNNLHPCYISGVYYGASEIFGKGGDTVDEIYSSISNLKSLNHQTQLQSCPTIY